MFTVKFWKNVAEDAVKAAFAAALPIFMIAQQNGGIQWKHAGHVALVAAIIVVAGAFTAGKGNQDTGRFNKGGE